MRMLRRGDAGRVLGRESRAVAAWVVRRVNAVRLRFFKVINNVNIQARQLRLPSIDRLPYVRAKSRIPQTRRPRWSILCFLHPGVVATFCFASQSP